MNRCDVLRGISDDNEFSKLVFDMVQKTVSEDDFEKLLMAPLTEDELQTIQSIAQSDYPLSFERKQ